ncbi:mitochondrial 2-enoyl thioester reductase [Apophysomyces ossiformis]|uniref:enoyl-[acyl-carrier-protein] reductase n=1 Tax=Apophysomyces ossiformis TaxID=679940 RepID=A0A8H7BN44_9FUNG|nr:mitochondrial 2-enoyl thioester reductase [Apophysomyces ossiformis]
MGFFIRALRQPSVAIRRAYTTATSDINVSAMVYSSYGKPSEVLKWHTYKLPALTPDTIQVKFLAAPVNPADVNQIQGAYPIKPPFLPLGDTEAAVGGNEGVAQVIAVGENVHSHKVGDHVVMAKAGYGTWRTHATGRPEDFQILRNTEGVSLIQQATIAVNPCTAYRMLKDFVTLQPDLDKLRETLKDLGATHVITDEELGTHEMRSQIKSWTKKAPLLGLNCVGGKNATEMARYLGMNGKFVTYGAMARAPLSLPASMLIFKNISFHGFWVSKWVNTHSVEERDEMFKDLTELMQQGKLAEPRWTKVDWQEEAMKEAVEKGIQGYTQGKQVVLF